MCSEQSFKKHALLDRCGNGLVCVQGVLGDVTFPAKSKLVIGPSSVQFAELRKSCLQLSSSDCNDVKVRGQSSNEAG